MSTSCLAESLEQSVEPVKSSLQPLVTMVEEASLVCVRRFAVGPGSSVKTRYLLLAVRNCE